MATKGQVTLRGRFKPRTVVALWKVAGEHVLRAAGGDLIDTKRVNDDGEVRFTSNVEVGARYFVVGRVDGFPLEVRVRGREQGDDAEVLEQPPVTYDRVKHADGSFVGERPEKRDPPRIEAAPHLGQDQVPDGVIQRSDTPRGTAHPLDPSEPAPYGRQEDVDEDVVQMSATETGRATPIDLGPQRQEDVPAGVWQRSATPTGVASPLPKGDAVRAQREKESSAAKERRGEPGRAAAEPLDVAKGAPKRGEVSNAPEVVRMPGAPDGRENRTGLDAQGQPAAPDVAAAMGLQPADKPAEAQRTVKDAEVAETPATSGKAAKEAATPKPSKRTTAKPPTGGKAEDQ